jgi:hypothetical protein
VIAVSDAINEPRYPSLKGIMGAKSKPQETLSLAELDADGVASRTEVYALSDPPARGESRKVEDDGNGAQADPRLPRGEAARMSTLVFLEHHGDELLKSSLGVLSKAASLGDGDVAGVVLGSNVRGLAEGAGKHGAAKVYVGRRRSARRHRFPQPRVDVLAQARAEREHRHRPLRELRARRRRRAGLGGASWTQGLNWDLVDLAQEDGKLVGKRPGAPGHRLRRRRLDVEPRLALFRSGRSTRPRRAAARRWRISRSR